jgi:hypothetical protein
MSETFALIRVVANDKETAERVALYLDDTTRPDFEEKVPLSEKTLFHAMEYAADPEEVLNRKGNIVEAWYSFIELSELEVTIAGLDSLPILKRYIFYANDEEYREYFQYKDNKLVSMYCAGEDEQFDNKLWEVEWSETAMDLVIEKVEKEMKQQLRESGKTISINYGKDTKENTILIRLHVKVKSKRKKLFDLFTHAMKFCEEFSYEMFVSDFNALIKYDPDEIVWGKLGSEEGDDWVYEEVWSDELIYGLSDVVEDDEYIYLAFNIDRITDDKYYRLDDYVWLIFIYLDGVKKVWVKYRTKLKKYPDRYLYYPGMGDESFFVDKEIQDDSDWPRIR